MRNDELNVVGVIDMGININEVFLASVFLTLNTFTTMFRATM